MTLPDVHLAGEAVAAYVDDALSPTARERADRHLRSCAECRAVVDAQREAKVLLAAALDPKLPSGLISRLREIPMTADLGGSDIVYAVDGEEFAWARKPAPRQAAGARHAGRSSEWRGGGPHLPNLPHLPPGDAPGDMQFAGQPVAAGSVAAPAGQSGGPWPRLGPSGVPPAAAGSRPSVGNRRDAAERGGRPESYPSSAPVGPSIRRRRGRRLAGALAGLAFGVIASAASTTSPTGTALPGQGGIGSGGGQAPVINRGSVPGQPLDAGTLNVGNRGQSRASLLTGSGFGR